METSESESFDGREGLSEILLKGLRLPTIRRLPKYLRLFREYAQDGHDVISSDKIAEKLNLDPITVRKDLAFTGIVGRPRVGYSISMLIKGIERIIKSKNQNNLILIGAGSLGTALMGYSGFEKHGYSFIAAFESDPAKIGTTIHDKPVFSIDQLPGMKMFNDNDIAVLCVPENAAQEVTDSLVKAGLKAIWNFTNTELKVPDDISVLSEDLASSLAVLSVGIKRNSLRPESIREKER
jgi:redox-sensing transcriptional repressor